MEHAWLMVVIMVLMLLLQLQELPMRSAVSVRQPDKVVIPTHSNEYRELIIANATDTSNYILLSDGGSYAWKFVQYALDRRLLVVVNTVYNTTIWVANRDHPVSANATLVLRFPQRDLLLHDPTASSGSSRAGYFTAWSTNSGQSISTIFINSTGNLVMQDIFNTTIWQSFDHPTDVLVPGQEITTNHSVTASLSSNDVSSGHYTLKVEPGGAVLYASFDAQQHHIPYALVNYANTFNFNISHSLHSACNKTSLLYNEHASGVMLLQNGPITAQCERETNGISFNGISFSTRLGGNGFRFLRLTPTGTIISYLVDSAKGFHVDNDLFKGFFGNYCKLPSYCGINSLCSSVGTTICGCPDRLFKSIDPSDSTRGCRLQTPLNCRNFLEHQFLQISGASYYANAYIAPATLQTGQLQECKGLCLANCSCTALFYDNSTSACYLYDQVHTMQSDSNPSVTAFLRVAQLPPDLQPSSNHSEPAVSTKLIIEVGFLFVTVGLLGLLLIIVVGTRLVGLVCSLALVFIWVRKRGEVPLDESDLEEESFLESLPGLPRRFSYKELHHATQGFSIRLGEGGSSTVFEGSLSSDRDNQTGQIAVKVLNPSGRSTIAATGKKQFREEVAMVGNASHVNLVQFKGFCAEGPHRLLVYEFMVNGSLDRWLFKKFSGNHELGQYNKSVLSWETRYQIAVDMARGLGFLHEECRDKVVHLDVKPQNILLDGRFRAKLADFGLCKLMHRGEPTGPHEQTVTAMRGTPGYMAPKWFMNLPVTDKSDVFSYGMVLLELSAGRKSVDPAATNEEDWYLPAWVVKQAETGQLLNVVDKQLLNVENGAPLDEITHMIHAALWCIQEDPTSRPAMSTVLLMLEGRLAVPAPPLNLFYVFHHRAHPVVAALSKTISKLQEASALLSPR